MASYCMLSDKQNLDTSDPYTTMYKTLSPFCRSKASSEDIGPKESNMKNIQLLIGCPSIHQSLSY